MSYIIKKIYYFNVKSNIVIKIFNYLNLVIKELKIYKDKKNIGIKKNINEAFKYIFNKFTIVKEIKEKIIKTIDLAFGDIKDNNKIRIMR